MDNINSIISENLKRLREAKKLSLDAVAKLSGVSKSMLGQIERGEVNPTISTVWKITNGLKLSFTELVSRPEADVELVSKDELHMLDSGNKKFRNYPVFPFEANRRFEMYYIEIEPGENLDSEAHPEETQEFITVFSGILEVVVNGQSFSLAAGSSIRFKADSVHKYRNTGDEICLLSMVIYYPDSGK